MREKSNKFKLIEEILKNSESKEWDTAKLEWECVFQEFEKEGFCICGHHLMNLYYIKNKINETYLIVGSSCVKKFDNVEMNNYLKETERQKKLEIRLEKQYEELKKKQSENQIPLSVRKTFLEKRKQLNVIDNYEYKFYMDIWNLIYLTEKQIKLKQRINEKLLNSIK